MEGGVSIFIVFEIYFEFFCDFEIEIEEQIIVILGY